MFKFITHFLLPKHTNNHKAKLIHPSTLFVIVFCVLLYQIVLFGIPKTGVRVLGYAANISVNEVVSLTNQKRAENGVDGLEINQALSSAAYKKGQDMLNNDYWAHVSPDGTQPWKFFIDEGYVYRYAGENLARDFSNPASAVEAWMASPSHRDNLLSPKYKEIGIGVVEGDLNGIDTTIIVQFFGTRSAQEKVSVPVAAAFTAEEIIPSPTIQPIATPTIAVVETPIVGDIKEGVTGQNTRSSHYEVSPFSSTRLMSLVILSLLLVVMVVDGIIVVHKKIPRKSGRLFAHLSFLSVIFIIVLIARAGNIL